MYEILLASAKIREAIRSRLSTDEIAKIAESEGMKPLRYRAIELVLSGITSLEELFRISFDVDIT